MECGDNGPSYVTKLGAPGGTIFGKGGNVLPGKEEPAPGVVSAVSCI